MHLSIFTKKYPVRVDQHHLAIGIDLAVNVRAAVAENAVKGYGIPAWLNIGHDLIGCDVVTVPVDDNEIGKLMNGGVAAIPANGASTNDYSPTFRSDHDRSYPC